jgi:hypothetical protein
MERDIHIEELTKELNHAIFERMKAKAFKSTWCKGNPMYDFEIREWNIKIYDLKIRIAKEKA